MLLAAALSVLIVATLLPRHVVRRSSFDRLRVLLPAWRFFENVHACPQLFARTCTANHIWGPWMPIIRAQPHRWFFAPTTNLELAYQSVVERFATELVEQATHPVTIDLIEQLVRQRVAGSAQFQWKVIDSGSTPTDIFVSEPVRT